MINLLRGLRVTAVLAVLCGLVYPLVVLGIGNLLFPFQAAGSMVTRHGQVVGSLLIAQPVTTAALFQPRPSAVHYNASLSGATNFGPTNPALVSEVRQNLRRVERENPGTPVSAIPPSMVESSGSGLDPDITVADALIQVPRVARATGIAPSTLDRLIRQDTIGRALGMWGDPMVDVLTLNLQVLKLTHA
jgi:K+-transporting ATPase ATPase C chain